MRENKKGSGKEERVDREGEKNGVLPVLSLGFLIVSGPAGALLAAWVNRARPGLYLWPLMACIWLFVFGSAGYFSAEGRGALFYGVCSVIGAACAVVQLAVLF